MRITFFRFNRSCTIELSVMKRIAKFLIVPSFCIHFFSESATRPRLYHRISRRKYILAELHGTRRGLGFGMNGGWYCRNAHKTLGFDLTVIDRVKSNRQTVFTFNNADYQNLYYAGAIVLKCRPCSDQLRGRRPVTIVGERF